MHVGGRTLFIIALVLGLVLPVIGFTSPATGQEPEGACARGVLIEGRCLSIDGLATDCLDGSCIQFVEEVTQVCPFGLTPIAGGDECERIDAALQLPNDCPDGARGEVNDCHIFVAKGPDGCPIGSLEILSGDCKRPVANAQGPFYCGDEDQVLLGRECRLVKPRVPSACSPDMVRFDGACWRVGTLAPPETCEGFGLANTVQLPSGQCRVPELIFRDALGCAEGTELLQGIQWLEYEPSTNTTIAEGPLVIGCVERGNAGGWTVSCLFDQEPWGENGGDEIDGVAQCTRFDAPLVASCLPEYSKDDSLGGQCARFSIADAFNPPECPEGWDVNGIYCVEVVEFLEFTCPAGMERRDTTTVCQELRPLRTTWSCVGFGLLASDGCWAFVGPQPDTCNALGTIDDCYSIQDPVAADCDVATGCITLGDFSIVGDVDCDADVTIIDALLIAQYSAGVRAGHGACADRIPATQLFLGDGDVNGDQIVDIIDALVIAQCDAGLPVLEGC